MAKKWFNFFVLPIILVIAGWASFNVGEQLKFETSGVCGTSSLSVETSDDAQTYQFIAWPRGYYAIYTNGSQEFGASSLCGGDDNQYRLTKGDKYQIMDKNGSFIPIDEGKVPAKSKEILLAGQKYFSSQD